MLPFPCPAQHLGCRHGAGDPVALHEIASHLPECPGVFHGFNAFGQNRVGEPLGQEDHALNDGAVAGILKHVANKTLVDLDDVHRKRAQVGQG